MFKSYTRKFCFKLNNDSFVLEATRFSGMEKLYKNGKLISGKRSIMKKEHHVISSGGENYKVQMVDHYIKGTYCSIFNNDTLIEKYVVTSNMPNTVNIMRPLSIVALAFILEPYINSRAINPLWIIASIFALVAINNQVVLHYERIVKSDA